jgi:hypothetical protein
MNKGLGVLAGVLALIGAWAGARADIVVATNGRYIDGKILSDTSTEIVIQPDGSMAPSPEHIARANVSRAIYADDSGQEIAGPTTEPAPTWNVPPEPAAPPVVVAKGDTYYVIPLHGEVGATVLASALKKSLNDAALRKPTVVVLDIDSPGGLVAEAERIIEIIHHYNKQMRLVAFTDQDLSAAAILSLSVREIYVKPTSTIGAATSFVPGEPNLSPEVQEKMQSAWRAVARNSAEEGGHDPLLADAMIDNNIELHLETVDGKPVVKEGPGDHELCRMGQILTLTSHEAVECGLAVGDAEDYTELGQKLGLADWTECKGLGTVLADYLPTRNDAYTSQTKKIYDEAILNAQAAQMADPTQENSYPAFANNLMMQRQMMRQYRRGLGYMPQPQMGAPMRPFGMSMDRLHWKQRSLACVVALQKLERNLADAVSLSEAFGATTDAGEITDALTRIIAIRANVYDNRDRFGPGIEDQPNGLAGGMGGVGAPAQRAPAPTTPPQVTPSEVTPAPTAPPQVTAVPAAPVPSAPLIASTQPIPPLAPDGSVGQLSPSFAGTIKTAIEQGTFVSGRIVGGAFDNLPFRELPPEGGLLIGFRYCFGSFAGNTTINYVQPIFLTAAGEVAGQGHGKATDSFLVLKAKAGYAVGAISIKGGGGLDAFGFKFMRILDGKLDPTDSYDSEMVGGSGGGPPRIVGGDGTPIIGLIGRENTDAGGDGITAIFLADTPTARPHRVPPQ